MDGLLMDTELERYGPAIVFFYCGLFLVGLKFSAVILEKGSPMTPELYGPAVYAFDAIYWCLLQMFTALLVVYGTLRKGELGASLVIIGGSLGFILYATFAVLAQKASQGILVQGASTFVTAPISLVVVLIGVRYLKYVRR